MKSVKYSFEMEVEKDTLGDNRSFYKIQSKLKPNCDCSKAYYFDRVIEVDDLLNVRELLIVVEETIKLNVEELKSSSMKNGIRPRVVNFNLDLKYSTI